MMTPVGDSIACALSEGGVEGRDSCTSGAPVTCRGNSTSAVIVLALLEYMQK